MKITVNPVPSGTAVVLGDDSAGAYIVDPPPMPAERRVAQVEALYEANAVFAKGRGNRSVSFFWTVARDHADAITAAAFALNHCKDVPIDCTIDVLNGSTTTSFIQAVIEEVTCVDLTGKSTRFRYSVVGAVPA